MNAGKKTGFRWLKALAILLSTWIILSAAGVAVFFTVYFSRYDNTADTPVLFADAEMITFPSGERMLQGWILRSEAETPKGIAVILHGFHAGAADMAGLGRILTEAGWDALCFDGTGTGKSGGSSVMSLQQRAVDAKAALDMLKSSRYAGMPVMLIGHSAGGWAAAIESRDEAVSAVICINGFETVSGLMLETALKYAGPVVYTGAPFLMGGLFLQNGSLPFEKASEALISSGKPVLIIQSGMDETVPEKESTGKALTGREDPLIFLCRIENARHTDLLPEENGADTPEEQILTEAIREFTEQITVPAR